ncbi:MAG: hypothetical protein WBC44_19060, partial [Planctomycetaceae bacterium]
SPFAPRKGASFAERKATLLRPPDDEFHQTQGRSYFIEARDYFRMVPVIEFIDHSQINFADATYRWIVLKRFSFSDDSMEHRTLLDSLIRCRWYRDHYASADSHEHDSKTIHGPYRLSEITAESFEAVTAAEAGSVVDEFCNLDEFESPPTDAVKRQIATQITVRIDTAASIFRLRQLDGAKHDWGDVLWEFRELVTISRTEHELGLIVMAID